MAGPRNGHADGAQPGEPRAVPGHAERALRPRVGCRPHRLDALRVVEGRGRLGAPDTKGVAKGLEAGGALQRALELLGAAEVRPVPAAEERGQSDTHGERRERREQGGDEEIFQAVGRGSSESDEEWDERHWDFFQEVMTTW